MRRRTLLLGLGSLAVASTGITATLAGESVSVSIPGGFWATESVEVEESLALDPDTANDLSTHTWEFTDLNVQGQLDTISVSYPDGTRLNRVQTADVSVAFTRLGEDEPTPIDAEWTRDDQTDGTIDLDDDADTSVSGPVVVEIDNIRNPEAGDHMAALSVSGATDEGTTHIGFTIVDEAPFFDVEITDAPSSVSPGDSFEVTYTATNTGDSAADQEVVATIDDDDEIRSDEPFLDPEDSWTQTVTVEVEDDRTDNIEFSVTSDDDEAQTQIAVTPGGRDD